jgi:sigma-B regulation protein RsbU (phosphoserine phosphatase)
VSTSGVDSITFCVRPSTTHTTTERRTALEPGPTLAPPALLEALPDAVVVADRHGRIAYVNPAIERLLGYGVVDLVGRPLEVLMPSRLRGGHEAGFARFLATGEGQLVGATTQVPALHADGHEVAIDLTLSRMEPIPGMPEEAVAVAVLRDASTTILLERQFQVSRYLAATLRVTAALTEAPDADAAFDRLLATLCAELDWDAATLWQPQPGGLLTYAGTWAAPGQTPQALEAATTGRGFTRGQGLPGLAWQQQQPVVIEDLWSDPRFLRREAARADTLRTGVAFPVLHGDAVLAVCELFSRERRAVPAELLEVLGHAGRQIGQFLGRLRAESEVRDLADTLQRSLLPSQLPLVPGVDLAARYRPGGGSGMVGGDTYDVTPLADGRWMVLVADVCGTGAEAAALTALTRHTARASAAATADGPADILCAVNAALLHEQTAGPLRFVTAACAILEVGRDKCRARIGVAGHPLPLLRREGGECSPVGVAGRPLGVESDCEYAEVSVTLPPGASLVFYTDGATEARDDTGRQFGEDGLLEVVRSAPPDVEGIVTAVAAAVEAQLRNSRFEADDLAVLALAVPR